MKHQFAFFTSALFMLSGKPSFAQTVQTARVTAAEIYMNDVAQVYREATLNLKKGIRTVVIAGIEGQLIDQNSVAVEIYPKGQVIRIFPPAEVECKDDDICREFQRQLERLQSEIQQDRLELEKLTTAEKILIQNANVTNSQNLNLNLLRESINYFRTETAMLTDAKHKRKTQIDEKQQKIQELQAKIQSRNRYLQTHVRNYSALVEVPQDGQYQIGISHLIRGINWRLQQEIDIDETEKHAIVRNLAEVRLTTEERWEDAELTLINKSFDLSGKPIEFRPLRAVFFRPRPVMTIDVAPVRTQRMAETAQKILANEDAEAEQFDISSMIEETIDGETFRLSGKYRLSKDTPLTKELYRDTLPVQLKYQIFPYVETKAQLLAICHTKVHVLRLNPSVIRLNGRAVGIESNPLFLSDDSVQIRLGTVNYITAIRKRQNLYSSRSFLGSSKKDTYEYSIQVTNRRNSDVTVTVIDRIPVSTDSRIEVKFKKTGQVEPDKQGMLRWEITLQPGLSRTLEYGFEIIYPKDKVIELIEDGNENAKTSVPR
ncbi:mucoidy inhibitor MuiA family protein [Schleiferia thermophila]|uniref:Uncharacterized protein (TIGR02231 family) n=1 Tax=Schleiferia thermophila TaxID=884107 RepID=A0A369ACB3_9FLAO|nr:mucoidy inhibitor MuiA family protein [Schleiferia thermophila]RCX05727.1 uncharacterized protein (TIGR02231 family) [Schleiferia thermophila]